MVNAACASEMDSFIMTVVNMFPEPALDLLAAVKNGNMLRVKNIQEKLLHCTLYIVRY